MIRVWAVVSGVLGVLAAGAGVAGLIAKPDAVVWAAAPLNRSVVVIPPQVFAMDGVQQIVVDADAPMETLMGRPSDAYAWIRGETSVVVRGLSSWETVDLLAPGLYRNEGDEPSTDIWRRDYASIGTSTLRPEDVPAGLVVIVASQDRSALGTVSIELRRDPGFGWAWPVISAGAVLAALSLVLFAWLWLDLGPSRADESPTKAASTKASSTKAATKAASKDESREDEPKPSRRARRLAREAEETPPRRGRAATKGAKSGDGEGDDS